jgi:erythritol kinase
VIVPSSSAIGGRDLLVGIDAGTSIIKAVAFDLAGRQIADLGRLRADVA